MLGAWPVALHPTVGGKPGLITVGRRGPRGCPRLSPRIWTRHELPAAELTGRAGATATGACARPTTHPFPGRCSRSGPAVKSGQGCGRTPCPGVIRVLAGSHARTERGTFYRRAVEPRPRGAAVAA